jgi:hypothetical protein
MKRAAASFFAAAVLFAQSVAAYEVHFDPAGNATDISFLIVGNASYDVTFEFGLYENVFPDLHPLFTTSTSDARPAADALASALSTPSRGPHRRAPRGHPGK